MTIEGTISANVSYILHFHSFFYKQNKQGQGYKPGKGPRPAIFLGEDNVIAATHAAEDETNTPVGNFMVSK